MGTVYRAHHLGLDREVALKLIQGDLVTDREFLLRFDREAKSLARLAHPRIVRLLDYGISGDRLYLAMQLVEGGSLESLLSGDPEGPTDGGWDRPGPARRPGRYSRTRTHPPGRETRKRADDGIW